MGAGASCKHGFIDEGAVEALTKDYPDAKTSLEEHASGNFTTSDMTLEAGALDDIDREFSTASFFSSEEAAAMGAMGAYTATTTLGSEIVTLNLRCLAAGATEPSARVALFLHGLGEDRCFGMWSKFWSPMQAQGFHIIAVDLPGFGRASGKDGDFKTWTHDSLDADLVLRLVASMKLPPGSVSVFAEGIGGSAFLRAYAKNPVPFAAHHVLLNVQIGSLPAGLKENLESNGADVFLGVCEMFYDGQTPWLCSGAATMMELLCDPSSMGLHGSLVIWKVKDPELAKKSGGSGQIGLSPFKSMKEGDWWTGRLANLNGSTRSGKLFLLTPSAACLEELVSYVAAPRKKVRPKQDGQLGGPERSAIEMGEINESFQVYIRVRPLVEREVKAGAKNCFVISDTDFPRDPPPQRIVAQETGGDESVKGNFVFNRVFDDSHGQGAVYAGAAKAYVADFLAGTNVTIFAYGQTGTGKTHTIMGPNDDRGIIPNCLTDIFQSLPAGKILVYQYVQLYMEDFKDLLVEESKGDLKLVDSKHGVRMTNLTAYEANGEDDIMRALEEGGKRRATRAQDMNSVSSRSHAILMLRLMDKEEFPDGKATSMFIVDLAGSERIARSGVTGAGFDEATSINLSLTALGRVVISLIDATSSKAFIPYNASPLTEVLKDGLGGNSKTCLIACVTQALDSISESVSSLRFAMQASHVKNKVARGESKQRAGAEKDKLAAAGHELHLDGMCSVPLPSGELQVHGKFDIASAPTVILLNGLGVEPASFQGLIDSIAAKGCQVIAPHLAGIAERELEADVAVMCELFDYVGLADPVIYARDWGMIRAIKFKMCHPKRAGTLVVENFHNKVDEAQYKARMKKDPGYAVAEYMGPMLWMYDSTFPKTLDGKPGKNMQGFKGKVVLLWPMCSKGRHDAAKKSAGAKMAEMYGKTLKTKEILDSFQMGDEDVADRILACLPKE